MTVPMLGGLVAAILATSFLSGLFGMAGGMVLMGVLLLMLPVPAAMVLHGVTQMASNGWRCWLWRRFVAWPVAAGYAVGALGALGLFALVSLVPDRATVLILLGALPFLNLAVPARLAPSVTRRGGSVLCGFLCTAIQLVAGVSGPALDLFFANSPLERREVVATKALSQTFGHLLKLVYFGGVAASAGEIQSGWVYVVAVATAIVGTTLSRRILDGMSDGQFRAWSHRLILTIGAVYVAQGTWAYAFPG